MKAIPQIQKYMTMTPYAVNAESNLDEAAKIMKKHDIRHLPVVLTAGKKYGIISDRDIKYAMSLSGFSLRDAKVKDICEEAPYVTKPSALIFLPH